jgi:hypothetical protein
MHNKLITQKSQGDTTTLVYTNVEQVLEMKWKLANNSWW